MTAFLKMHGLGNDFVVFDARKQGLALSHDAVRAIADRRLGIGCDQVIVIERGKPGFDATMRSLNADGSEVESCGNASRCVARLLMEELDRTEVHIATRGGPLICTDAGGDKITVDMGPPRFDWKDIPLSESVDTNAFPLRVDDEDFVAAAVSVGNPHCVLFVEDAEKADVARIGAKLETHPLFPERTNVEFVSVRDRSRLRMRVWERGTGITSACGTGACATVAAASRRGLVGRNVEVLLDGGPLSIMQRESDSHILMTGPARLSFRGDLDFESYS
jgi:diaminopimelate epimerase